MKQKVELAYFDSIRGINLAIDRGEIDINNIISINQRHDCAQLMVFYKTQDKE